MSNRIFWSREFQTWVVEVNLSQFAFISKKAAEDFLDAFENGVERDFVDDDELEPGIGHKETHSTKCQRDERFCRSCVTCTTKKTQ